MKKFSSQFMLSDARADIVAEKPFQRPPQRRHRPANTSLRVVQQRPGSNEQTSRRVSESVCATSRSRSRASGGAWPSSSRTPSIADGGPITVTRPCWPSGWILSLASFERRTWSSRPLSARTTIARDLPTDEQSLDLRRSFMPVDRSTDSIACSPSGPNAATTFSPSGCGKQLRRPQRENDLHARRQIREVERRTMRRRHPQRFAVVVDQIGSASPLGPAPASASLAAQLAACGLATSPPALVRRPRQHVACRIRQRPGEHREHAADDPAVRCAVCGAATRVGLRAASAMRIAPIRSQSTTIELRAAKVSLSAAPRDASRGLCRRGRATYHRNCQHICTRYSLTTLSARIPDSCILSTMRSFEAVKCISTGPPTSSSLADEHAHAADDGRPRGPGADPRRDGQRRAAPRSSATACSTTTPAGR